MLLQIGEQKVLENILIGFKANGISMPESEADLRCGYQDYLKRMQPHCSWLRPEPVSQIGDAVCDINTKLDLIAIFGNVDSGLDDLHQAKVIKPAGGDLGPKQAMISEALSAMKSQTPAHYDFLNNCIEAIFFEESDIASGGSTSNAVGAIWANPDLRFRLHDTIELLVHELTHNLMFLDEWVHPHYDYDLILSPETWCQSAILMTKRPVDKVVHSIMVATEIVLLRRMITGEPTEFYAHPPSVELVEAILKSIDDLRTLPQSVELLQPRVRHLLDVAEEKLAA
ncbi:hypothetical protein FHW19_004182 [Ochrobactrum anthropi]|uniref:aKG-HExxH-type peptide beta-hydroxylase n=1 Tax=Brucella anthropi TaxID=529 RepID=UPI0015FA810F|nr:HEXXH motif-containing putative peptide modification protein [Brucella anthropi]MBA8862436.1 hypothetical protein [Brucella anthropi]